MRDKLIIALAAGMFLSLAAPSTFAQNNNNATAVPTVSKPTPRRPDGKPYFGPVQGVPGAKGLWNYPFGAELATDEGEAMVLNPSVAGETMRKPALSEVPFQPWARALYDFRELTRLEPYTRCKPSAGARQPGTAYGTQLVDFPDLGRFFVFQTGGSHSYRTVYMDGRPHPPNFPAAYYGHAVGRWEGDTLVIDSVGFNERMWIENIGMPHTDKLHLVERITRVSFDWVKWEFIIEDPGAYTATWRTGYYMRLNPENESFEFVCQDNNQAHELMVGAGETTIDRDTLFVP